MSIRASARNGAVLGLGDVALVLRATGRIGEAKHGLYWDNDDNLLPIPACDWLL